MKKLILVSVIGFLTFSCNQVKEIIPQEPAEKVQRVYQGEINDIEVSNAVDVEIIKSNVEKVVLEGDDKQLQHVVVRLNEGNLEIGIEKQGFFSFNDEYIKAKVYVKDFHSVEASSSGNIMIKDKFTQDETLVKVSSSGVIKGDLEANQLKIMASSSGDFIGKIWAVNLDAKVSSSGDIKISGKTKNANIVVSSSGDFKAENLLVSSANLRTSSSGNIKVKVSDKVRARTSSSGDIIVYNAGNLTDIKHEESSSGEFILK